MSLEFTWNEMQFRAVCQLDNDPEGYCDFVVTKLFLTDGKVEVNAMGLFLCEEACNELNDAAYAAYQAEIKYERSFP